MFAFGCVRGKVKWRSWCGYLRTEVLKSGKRSYSIMKFGGNINGLHGLGCVEKLSFVFVMRGKRNNVQRRVG